MSNNYFQFKEFRIQQAKGGMKVTTDACLFGALASPHYSDFILDIGAGTGLLSLMLAQRTQAQIYAVELDAQAAAEATENFRGSQWSNRLNLFHADVRNEEVQYRLGSQKFDYIITNPPFYTHQSQSPVSQRQQAHHQVTLTFEDLLKAIRYLLTERGHFDILLPPNEMNLFVSKAKNNGFTLKRLISVRNFTDNPTVFRQIASFSAQTMAAEINSVDFVIYDAPKQYTTEFVQLLKPYYLYL
ncbi:MAG: methyltransferase domain-containing protein [Cytophagales bacterium]|nr:MAG: methyltransferase domain-containing protein [Cytophagales bacterium]TAF61077.1 MAG: methyltransferase domain-containing protein [Cytophagales bacterium]